MATPVLKIENLKKDFRSHWMFRRIPAVKSVSLAVAASEAFGFLGYNGAGKTTTIKCILGLVRPSAGKIYFQGKSITPAHHREIGYLPEHPYFYEHLSVRETLNFFAALHNFSGQKLKQAVSNTLETLGLEDRETEAVKNLSKGLKQKLGFAQAIINKPTLLLLDEPFSGLDPHGRYEMRELILTLKKQGTTVFLSSHILSDVEEICDRVSIMSEGEIKTSFHLKEKEQLFGEAANLEDIFLSLTKSQEKNMAKNIDKN